MSEKWNVTWNPVHFSMTDSRGWTSADISQGWHCFKTSNCDTCQPQSHTQSTLPTHTHTHLQTHWSSTSITIIHQIYLHWSRTKIKLTPLSPPTLPGHPRPNPITARYLPWLIGFQSNWISLRWRWEEERLPCSKPLGIGIGRRAGRGAKWRYRREMGKRREVIEGDWGRAR